MIYSDIEQAAQARQLTILGVLHPAPSDLLPVGTQTLVLFGPNEPDFWPHFITEPEYNDDLPDPMDRWSKRMVTDLATIMDGQAFFPSDGPPYPPFFQWALQSGQCFQSPIQLLVHDRVGMFISFRGAIALSQRILLPSGPLSPCLTCKDTPCAFSCPVDAFGNGHYDVPACKSHISTDEGRECVSHGCIARRRCPVSEKHPRVAAQSEFHMRAFLDP